ncbi:MAG: response regulator [Cytophagales bacterium]|nr:response regulator [Cytophagales bacterium]
MKLLIVDDSIAMQKTIERHLNGYDLEIVGTANNGKVALEMVKSKNPDCVTLDITMPEMDGITCLENMKKIKPEIKVMIITALSDKHTGLLAIEKGARGFLFKPVDPDDLAKAFDSLLNRN